MRFRLLTLNTGLFRLRLGPWSFLDPVPHPATRIHHLADAVRSVDPDVIAFQEVYADRDLDRLRAELGSDYPYYSSARDHVRFPRIRAHSGLAVFSRFPILNNAHIPLAHAALDERPFTGKGFLQADIASPVGTVSLANIHLTSGGIFRNPRLPSLSRVRNGQIDQVTSHMREKLGDVRLIVGDLNAGPDVSPENYNRVLEQGFLDAWHMHPNPTRREKEVTWEVTNPLNSRELHKTDAPQRIDHVFIHPAGLENVAVTRAEVVLHEPRVPTRNGLITVSDHYGVVIELTKKENASGSTEAGQASPGGSVVGS